MAQKGSKTLTFEVIAKADQAYQEIQKVSKAVSSFTDKDNVKHLKVETEMSQLKALENAIQKIGSDKVKVNLDVTESKNKLKQDLKGTGKDIQKEYNNMLNKTKGLDNLGKAVGKSLKEQYLDKQGNASNKLGEQIKKQQEQINKDARKELISAYTDFAKDKGIRNQAKLKAAYDNINKEYLEANPIVYTKNGKKQNFNNNLKKINDIINGKIKQEETVGDSSISDLVNDFTSQLNKQSNSQKSYLQNLKKLRGQVNQGYISESDLDKIISGEFNTKTLTANGTKNKNNKKSYLDQINTDFGLKNPVEQNVDVKVNENSVSKAKKQIKTEIEDDKIEASINVNSKQSDNKQKYKRSSVYDFDDNDFIEMANKLQSNKSKNISDLEKQMTSLLKSSVDSGNSLDKNQLKELYGLATTIKSKTGAGVSKYLQELGVTEFDDVIKGYADMKTQFSDWLQNGGFKSLKQESKTNKSSKNQETSSVIDKIKEEKKDVSQPVDFDVSVNDKASDKLNKIETEKDNISDSYKKEKKLTKEDEKTFNDYQDKLASGYDNYKSLIYQSGNKKGLPRKNKIKDLLKEYDNIKSSGDNDSITKIEDNLKYAFDSVKNFDDFADLFTNNSDLFNKIKDFSKLKNEWLKNKNILKSENETKSVQSSDKKQDIKDDGNKITIPVSVEDDGTTEKLNNIKQEKSELETPTEVVVKPKVEDTAFTKAKQNIENLFNDIVAQNEKLQKSDRNLFPDKYSGDAYSEKDLKKNGEVKQSKLKSGIKAYNEAVSSGNDDSIIKAKDDLVAMVATYDNLDNAASAFGGTQSSLWNEISGRIKNTQQVMKEVNKSFINDVPKLQKNLKVLNGDEKLRPGAGHAVGRVVRNNGKEAGYDYIKNNLGIDISSTENKIQEVSEKINTVKETISDPIKVETQTNTESVDDAKGKIDEIKKEAESPVEIQTDASDVVKDIDEAKSNLNELKQEAKTETKIEIDNSDIEKAKEETKELHQEQQKRNGETPKNSGISGLNLETLEKINAQITILKEGASTIGESFQTGVSEVSSQMTRLSEILSNVSSSVGNLKDSLGSVGLSNTKELEKYSTELSKLKKKQEDLNNVTQKSLDKIKQAKQSSLDSLQKKQNTFQQQQNKQLEYLKKQQETFKQQQEDFKQQQKDFKQQQQEYESKKNSKSQKIPTKDLMDYKDLFLSEVETSNAQIKSDSIKFDKSGAMEFTQVIRDLGSKVEEAKYKVTDLQSALNSLNGVDSQWIEKNATLMSSKTRKKTTDEIKNDFKEAAIYSDLDYDNFNIGKTNGVISFTRSIQDAQGETQQLQYTIKDLYSVINQQTGTFNDDFINNAGKPIEKTKKELQALKQENQKAEKEMFSNAISNTDGVELIQGLKIDDSGMRNFSVSIQDAKGNLDQVKVTVDDIGKIINNGALDISSLYENGQSKNKLNELKEQAKQVVDSITEARKNQEASYVEDNSVDKQEELNQKAIQSEKQLRQEIEATNMAEKDRVEILNSINTAKTKDLNLKDYSTLGTNYQEKVKNLQDKAGDVFYGLDNIDGINNNLLAGVEQVEGKWVDIRSIMSEAATEYEQRMSAALNGTFTDSKAAENNYQKMKELVKTASDLKNRYSKEDVLGMTSSDDSISQQAAIKEMLKQKGYRNIKVGTVVDGKSKVEFSTQESNAILKTTVSLEKQNVALAKNTELKEKNNSAANDSIEASQKYVARIGSVSDTGQKYQSAGDKWMSGLKAKLNNLTQYVTGIQMVMTAWNQVQQGFSFVKDFNSALTTINQTMSATQEQLNALGQGSINAGKQLGASAEDVLDAAAIYANANETTESVLEKAKPTVLLANASGEDTSTVADQIQAVTKQFEDLDGQETRIVNSYEKISASLGIDFAKGINMMSEAVQASGSVAEQAGKILCQNA